MLQNEVLRRIRTEMSHSLPEGRLHFTAHSHHPWPDSTEKAQLQAWRDATRHLDSKWDVIFSKVLPQSKKYLARLLGFQNPNLIVEGQNTFEFLTRLLSCYDFSQPLRILTTDSEFYSWTRLQNRIQEFSNIQIDTISTQPFETFVERFEKAHQSQNYDFIFSSLVFFNSGFYAQGLLESLMKSQCPTIVIDLYHALGAVDLNLNAYSERYYFTGGGYKYLSAGEGACFLTVPTKCELRPWQTGWFADFESLEKGVSQKTNYASGSSRMAGATFDATAWYRFNAVQKWWDEIGLNPRLIHQHVQDLQKYFTSQLEQQKTQWSPEDVLGYQSHPDWGNFLCLRTANPHQVVNSLREKNIFVDSRGEFVRFGFGYYQSFEEIDLLFKALSK